MRLFALLALLAFVPTPHGAIGPMLAMQTYYDIVLLMKRDEIARCYHMFGDYFAVEGNVICRDIRRP